MIIVIPMAGDGRRFSDAGYSTPKPLIDVLGMPMYARAVDSLPLDLARRVIFLVRTEHLTSELRIDIETRFGAYAPEILPVQAITEGQMCTVLLARELIDSGEILLIHNADTACSSSLSGLLDRSELLWDGAVTVFSSTDPRFSFARLDENGAIVEIREKDVISPWATTGTYVFRRGSEFIRYADEAIARNLRHRGEFYVGPLFNLLIRDGGRVLPDFADRVDCMGTPEELTQFIEAQST